jgi:integrase
MLLSCFFETHYLPYNPSTASKTIKLYQHSFRMFGLWLGHAATLDDLQNEIVGKYLSHLFRSELKPASVNKERSQLLAVWNHAHKLGMVRLGPLVKPVKAPETIPTSLTVDDLRKLCNSFDKLLGSTRGVENRLLIRAAFLLQYVTAERIGAIVQLQWSDIKGQQISFRAETRKCGTRSIVRTVPAYVIAALNAIRIVKSLFVFPEQKTSKLLLLYDRLFKRAGIDRPKGKSSHLLRSTHATFLNLAGGDATGSLGHQSSGTTRKSYIDPRLTQTEFWKLIPSLN